MAATAAVGMFDGVHLGHQALVDCVRRHAEAASQSPIVFTFDRHPLQLVAPGHAPGLLTPVDERLGLLCQAGADRAYALRFDEEMRSFTARRFMEMLRGEYGVRQLVLGFNHRFGSDRLSHFSDYQAIGQDLGVNVILCDKKVESANGAPISSSAIRALLAEGKAAEAALMLGRPYALAGTVVHGRGLGHTIGFPTANIAPAHPDQIVPAPGVYACLASIDGMEAAPAMVNIGTRPTVEGHHLTIEANIIGLDADIYGRHARLQFAHRLRSEQRFPSVSDLARQLARDRRLTLEIINDGPRGASSPPQLP